MAVLSDYLPPYGVEVLRMPVEELAVRLMGYLRRHEVDESRLPAMHNLLSEHVVSMYVPDTQGLGGTIEMQKRLAEAWGWLYSHGYIADDPTRSPGGHFVTDRGRALADNPPTPHAFEAEYLLPLGSLHPIIEAEARPDFMRGRYDLAVFAAFRAVEISVRNAAGLQEESGSVPAMRKAFHLETGPLTDAQADKGEREGMGHLFAGAMAVFRNPTGHREVRFTDPKEVAGIIRTADVLMRIVDRTPGAQAQPVEETLSPP